MTARTVPGTRKRAAGSVDRGQVIAWGLAGAAVVAMVGTQLARPIAGAVEAADASTFLSPQAIEVATAYRAPLRAAALVSVTLRVAGAAAAAWSLWRRTAGVVPDARWRRCLLAGAIGAGVWAMSDLVRLPLHIWAWSRSVDVGLSTQALPAWMGDWLLEHGLYWLGVGLAVAGIAWAIERLPRLWVPVVGLVGGVVGVALMLLSPLLFEPLLLSFTPLPDGEVRQGILALTDQAEVQAELLVADASRRTTASNAYVSGLGATRRIVVYDTLLRDAPSEEVLAIVAHELAHDRNRDLERTAAGLLGVTVLLVAATAWAVRGRVHVPAVDASAGHHEVVRPAVAAPAVALVVLLLVVTGPVERWSSRRAESAADAGAIALIGDGDPYEAMMTGLAQRNLSDPTPPGWYITLFNSHPPIGERIARARVGG